MVVDANRDGSTVADPWTGQVLARQQAVTAARVQVR
jgi:hypothetical protein